MELVTVILAVLTICTLCFWSCGLVYGLLRRPAVLFPFGLALKMMLAALAGSLVLGFGGVITATWVMNAEFQKRADYNAPRCLLAGVIISIICLFVTAYSAIALAWQIIG